MKAVRYLQWGVGLFSLALLVITAGVGYRVYRVWSITTSVRDQIRYLVEKGEPIEGTEASKVFGDDYLASIMSDDPALLAQLKSVINKGLEQSPLLNLGEVSAMNLTYHRGPDGQVRDFVAYVTGTFPQGERPTGFHIDGYFNNLLDADAYKIGNNAVRFLGRDIIFFTEESNIAEQQHLLESVLNGNIMPLVSNLSETLHYSTVIPNPTDLLPPQLQSHIQAVVVKGTLSHARGSWDIIAIARSERSASYAISIFQDLKTSAEVILGAVLGGTPRQGQWGEQYIWWARAMLNTSRQSQLQQDGNLVRLKAVYQRVMVNAVLKSIERMGRDIAAQRLRAAEKDPRLARALREANGANGQDTSPLSYWSQEHVWGPDWPISFGTSNAPVPDITAAGEQTGTASAEPTAVPTPAPAPAQP